MELDIGILLIDELLVISESRKLDFRTVTYSWMGGIRRIEQANSRSMEL